MKKDFLTQVILDLNQNYYLQHLTLKFVSTSFYIGLWLTIKDDSTKNGSKFVLKQNCHQVRCKSEIEIKYRSVFFSSLINSPKLVPLFRNMMVFDYYQNSTCYISQLLQKLSKDNTILNELDNMSKND